MSIYLDPSFHLFEETTYLTFSSLEFFFFFCLVFKLAEDWSPQSLCTVMLVITLSDINYSEFHIKLFITDIINCLYMWAS